MIISTVIWSTLAMIWQLGLVQGPETDATCFVAENHRVNCSYRYLDSIPEDIPKDAIAIDLSHNSIKLVPKGSFTEFSDLVHLDLSYNTLTKIHIDAFSGLHLNTLSLKGNKELGLDKAMTSLSGLQNQSMSIIDFSRVNTPISAGKPTLLDMNMTRYLRNICFQTLDLSYDYIDYMDLNLFKHLEYPTCITHFSIRHHRLVKTDRGISFISLLYISLITKNVTYLDISGSIDGLEKHLDNRMINRKPAPLSANVSFSLPRFFETLNMSYLIGRGLSSFDNTLYVINGENLKNFDASYNGIGNCTGQIFGIQNLRVFNVSGWDCSVLSPEFLSPYPNLQTLVFADANLNKGLENDKTGRLLRKLTKLISLDLSGNGLTSIHNNLLTTNQHLKIIDFSNNKVDGIPSTILSLKSVEYLDLSYNAIRFLDKDTTDKLDDMVNNDKEELVLNLEGNPFLCGCLSYEFIEWTGNTHVTILGIENASCVMDNGTKSNMFWIKADLENMRIACESQVWLIFSVSLVGMTVLLVILSVVGYQYRWRIRYWCFTKCKFDYELVETPDNYEYDAFVAYNHEDEVFAHGPLLNHLETEENQYHVCLGRRDFKVGHFIQQNIVNAINTSRKIILVLSMKYVECDWGEFEIQMARMRMIQRGRDNLIIAILLEDIPLKKMPRALLNLWSRITFLLWSDEDNDQEQFWMRLQDAMKPDA